MLVEGAEQPHLLTFLNKLRQVGGAFEVLPDGIRFFHPGRPLRPIALETDVHPGFMTDWQPPFVMLMTQVDGPVRRPRDGLRESLRLHRGAGADGRRDPVVPPVPRREALPLQEPRLPHSCVVQGPTPLRAADMTIPDLRAGFSYLIAAAVAEGVSRISGIRSTSSAATRTSWKSSPPSRPTSASTIGFVPQRLEAA